ncbi:MAG: ABC transporter ATP-binding protein [Chitinispirillaceae bacterium]|nr:ABC transporter ATP-binding protein [Chitinispirillaceae bacterium]
MLTSAIKAENLHKKFGDVTALDNVSFAVPEGSLFGLIGADGAGKTTLLRILVTLLDPDSGSATVLGADTAKDLRAIRSGIGYMPQRFSLYQDLSVRENIVFFADVFGIPAAERSARMERLLAFSRLGPFQGRRAAALSGGMKQKLALSCALVHTPRLLILDEPTTGVDPVSRKEFWDILFELRRQGMTILVSTPYMDEAELCDALLLLHKGEVLRRGTPASLLESYPYRLYRVTGRAGSLSVSRKTPLPGGAVLMYPAAGAVHVAAADRSVDPDMLLEEIRRSVPDAGAIAAARPCIEDLLFALLSGRETA